MKLKTTKVLGFLKVMAWIAFFAYTVFIGSVLISYIVSIKNPEGAANLYEGFNLFALYQYNFGLYSITILIIILLIVLKASIWYMTARTISMIQLKNPFTKNVVRRLELISYTLFAIWVLGIAIKFYVEYLRDQVNPVMIKNDPHEFLFMAGLVFIISQIFKRGVELQSENELTI